jgi:hypothetical protein
MRLLAAAQTARLRLYWCERLEEPDQDTRDIGISIAVRKFVAGQDSYPEQIFDRTPTRIELAQRQRKGQPLPPQLDVKIS